MIREIPINAIEIQKGLWQEINTFIVAGVSHYNSRLYSSYGYCFYDKTTEIYRDEELVKEEDILPSERTYMQFCVTPLTNVQEINAIYQSVPVSDEYQIV